MRVVFFGSGAFATPSLRWLVNSRHEVVAVITQPDQPAGRGKKLLQTPVAVRADSEKLDVWRCEDVNTPAVIEAIRALKADIGIVIDFGQKLDARLRSVFPSECINLHPSLLPSYPGATPVARAILADETKTGVTVFRLVDRMDAGPILVQRQTMIAPSENQQELLDRLAGVGCDAIDAALTLHEADPLPPGEPQDESRVTYAPKLCATDGCIRFDEPAELIARKCRAFWPWPGVRCRYVPASGKKVEVALCAATATPTADTAAPGTVTNILTIATGAGTLEIHSLRPAGKRLMSWLDFVNGRHVQPGDKFEAWGS